MEAKKSIPYEGEVIQGEKYITECGIEFVYDEIGNKEKPYLLNNGIRINHIPGLSDIGTNNLKPLGNNQLRTKDEQKDIQSKGGNTSVGNRRQRKTFRESIDFFLSLEATNSDMNNLPDEIKEKFPDGVVLSQADLIVLKAIEQSKSGSDKFSVFLRDTIGEKPTNEVNVTADVITENDRALIDKIGRRLQGEM